MRSQFTSRAFPEINISFPRRNDDISRRFECYLIESRMHATIQRVFLPENSLIFEKNFPPTRILTFSGEYNYPENALHMYVYIFFVI